jgi:hypothetical protein
MIACTECFAAAGPDALTLHRTGEKTLRVQFAETMTVPVPPRQPRQPQRRRVVIAFGETTFTPVVRHVHNQP